MSALRPGTSDRQSGRIVFRRRMRFVFRHFPLSEIHPHSEIAAESAEFAGEAGRFWEMHDALFENQSRLSIATIFLIAAELRLPETGLRHALETGQYRNKVRNDFIGGVRSGVNGQRSRRQIVELLLPGDFFGFTTRHEYDSTVEAVAEDTIVASYPRRRVEILAEADPQLSREIRQVMFEALSRLQAQLMILGRITATEKVSSFLLTMAERLFDQTLDRVDLPISRYDIANYLGLSVETVCRWLTSLKKRGLIALSGPRSVRIIDRDALEEGGACDAYPKHLAARRGCANLSAHSS
jgi:CRP/FNR family nitrogen fixation transcriptional regulator